MSEQTALSEHSRYAQRVRRRFAAELALLPVGPPDAHSMGQTYAALQAAGHGPAAALRILRQLVLERLLALDCDAGASLTLVTQAMTALAEFALDRACCQALQTLDARHGMPATAQGQRAELWLLGMGKLGARELNVSSDIDLIFVYDQDGQTVGDATAAGRISNHEYFVKAVRAITSLLADNTEHGWVFRVDLALRPNGNSGPAALSLNALEDYFHTQGREWERFAWLKSRVLVPRPAVIRTGALQALRRLVTAFVFRRYLDYSVFDALRLLHRQIRQHAARRSAGRPERSDDVKLARGGIRELEFTVQLLQVVRGGQFPELRTRPTLSALARLVQAGLMPEASAQALSLAYVFLRRVEHRIQYLDDQQTHVLPTQDADLDWIARSMGYASAAPFLTQLNEHRERVAQEFDTLLGGASADACGGCGVAHGKSDHAAALPDWDALLAALPALLREQLAPWPARPTVQSLSESSRSRLLRLLARTSQWLSQGQVSANGTLRWLDWLEPLLRREHLLALLWERPAAHQRLLHLLGAAKWPARYLRAHPGVIDELANSNLLHQRFAGEAFVSGLAQRRLALQASGDDDEEALLNLLRRAQQAEILRTLARDVEGVLTVEQVGDDLSALADATLGLCAAWCWDSLKKKHRSQPQLAILAYGKLGGLELGYGGDLDLVFVFDDEDRQAAEVYAALVRKLIHWLTVKTSEGELYDIDTALRPNGNAGLLITTFDAFANYQQQRGSNAAWTWEHQAITRARCVLGGAGLRARFDAVRLAVIASPRAASALAQEIQAMRARVQAAHPTRPATFDLKYSPGGMLDVEFAVQYLVLAQAHRYPQLSVNLGNIALLQQAQTLGLLPPGLGDAAANAYRELRRLQHLARLNEESTQLPASTLGLERAAVQALWSAVFAEQAGSNSN